MLSLPKTLIFYFGLEFPGWLNALSSQVKWTEQSKHQATFQVEMGAKQMKGICIFGADTYLKTLTLSLKEGADEDGLVINYQDYKSL